MKNRKRKMLLFSLLSLYVVSVSGISGYAVVTGSVPPVLSSISSNFFAVNRSASPPNAPQTGQEEIQLGTDTDPSINPYGITPSDSQESPVSTSSVDPDSKIIDDQINNQNNSYISTEPISVTTSQQTMPPNPENNNSSQAPISSPPVSSSAPTSSSPVAHRLPVIRISHPRDTLPEILLVSA